MVSPICIDAGVVIQDAKLHLVAFEFAGRLGLEAVYDAHYLALAELSSAELWTTDERLVNRALNKGIDWYS